MEIRRYQTDVDGQAIHYLKSGCGFPVILIHGLLGGSFCWRFNVPTLAQNHTVMAIELPGFGESEAARDLDCSMEAQAFRLCSLLEKLGIESADVVGSSWGAGVAILFSAMSPRVRSLVLAAPVSPWSEFGRERVRFFGGKTGAALLRLGVPISRPIHLWALQRMYGDPARIPAGTLKGYSKIILTKGRAFNLLSTLRSWEKDLAALRKAVDQVKAPTLLIWGSKDSAVDISSAEVLMEKLPACERAIIEGAGHLPFEETPEEFNSLVIGFLQRVSSTASPA